MLQLLRRLLPCALAVAGLACEVARPDSAYEPLKPVADAGDDDDDDDERDASRVNDEDDPYEPQGPSSGGKLDASSPRGSDGSDTEPSQSHDALVGHYWMLHEGTVSATARQGAIAIETNTATKAYSLVRVFREGAALKFEDWQCAIEVSHTCTAPCTSMQTTLHDVNSSARAYWSALRTLEIDASGSWKATRAPFAVGWKGRFESDPELAVPTSEGDPLIYDADGDGAEGVSVQTSVKPFVGAAQICNMRVAQKFDFVYEGKLTNGQLTSGKGIDLETSQVILSSDCKEATATPNGNVPGSLKLKRVEPFDAEKRPWPCPSLNEFKAGLK